MEYKKTPVSKKVSKEAIDTAIGVKLKDISTLKIQWYVVKRHKFGLLATWAIIITLLYMFPPLPGVLISFIGS